MTYKNIKRIVNETISDLAKNIIFQKGSSYYVYDSYIIKKINDCWSVEGKTIDVEKVFCTSRSALSWCIAHHSGNYMLAQKIFLYDKKLGYKQKDIELLLNSIKNNDNEVFKHRLSHDIDLRQYYKKQLSNYTKIAKYIKK